MDTQLPNGLQPTREHGENVQTHSARGLPNRLADGHNVQGRHTAGPQVQGQGGGVQELSPDPGGDVAELL